MASLLLAASDARAGSYVTTYDGGSVKVVGGTEYPFTSTDGRSADETVSSSRNTGGNSIQVGASGGNSSPAITATFTWTHDNMAETDASDPPPTAVIVEQDSYVYWQTFSSDGTGSANSGLPEAITASTAPSGTSQNTDYSAGAGGASFSVSCTPTASFSGSNGTVKVQYNASVAPITLTVSGTTLDSSGNPNILVGQPATGTVNGIPSDPGWSAAYDWSGISGTTFETWSSTTPAIGTAPANSQASYYSAVIPATNPASWYWNDMSNASETVKCKVMVTPPTNEGSPFSLTVNAPKPISVQVPSWTATGTGGNLQVNKTNPPSDGTDYWLYAGPTDSPTDTGGIVWRVTVTSPNPALFGDGSPQITQLITPGLSYTTRDANKVVTTYNWSENGKKGLDDGYPYDKGNWVTQPPNYPTYYAGDEPGIDVGYLGAYSGTVNDSFEDYLMYRAPGSSQPVPLAHFTWSTSGTATAPGTGWKDFGTGSAGSVTPSGAAVNFSAYNTFPKWTLVTDVTQTLRLRGVAVVPIW